LVKGIGTKTNNKRIVFVR